MDLGAEEIHGDSTDQRAPQVGEVGHRGPAGSSFLFHAGKLHRQPNDHVQAGGNIHLHHARQPDQGLDLGQRAEEHEIPANHAGHGSAGADHGQLAAPHEAGMGQAGD